MKTKKSTKKMSPKTAANLGLKLESEMFEAICEKVPENEVEAIDVAFLSAF
jgi:hypothetical protein